MFIPGATSQALPPLTIWRTLTFWPMTSRSIDSRLLSGSRLKDSMVKE
jgi:hypothetical protein